MFTPRFWFKDKLSSGVALFSKTAPGHRLSEQLLQHVYVYWLTHSVELHSKEIALCSQKRQHPAPVNGQTKIHLISKQVQIGTLYKGNNDVAKGFIGCHVISIMILPVQYAFFGPVHSLPVAWGYTIRKIFSCYNVLPAVPKGAI